MFAFCQHNYYSKCIAGCVCLFAEEMLTDQDFENFKTKESQFLQLRSVKEITNRCAKRDVLPEKSRDNIVECFELACQEIIL